MAKPKHQTRQSGSRTHAFDDPLNRCRQLEAFFADPGSKLKDGQPTKVQPVRANNP